MTSFAADCSVDKEDRLTIDLHEDSASVCIIYSGKFSQVILSKEDVRRLLEFVQDNIHNNVLPSGFKAVPIEPTKEMLFACEDAGSIHNLQRGKRIYKAMLEAAPVLDVKP